MSYMLPDLSRQFGSEQQIGGGIPGGAMGGYQLAPLPVVGWKCQTFPIRFLKRSLDPRPEAWTLVQ